jgi:hypothetical protein
LGEGFDSISEVPRRSTADVKRARVSNASEGTTVVGCLWVMRGDGDVEGRGAMLKGHLIVLSWGPKLRGTYLKHSPYPLLFEVLNQSNICI